MSLFSQVELISHVSIFRTSGEECDWSEEEEDKLIMWYNQLEGERNIIEKLSDKFGKDDMKKSKLEVGYFKGCFVWRENLNLLDLKLSVKFGNSWSSLANMI